MFTDANDHNRRSISFISCLGVRRHSTPWVSLSSALRRQRARTARRRPQQYREAAHAVKPISCSLGSSKLPASTVSVKDAATGAQILLVGCVHGSRVSAEDVRKVLDKTTPDVVILELCESRLQTLRTMASQKSENNQRLSKDSKLRKRQSFSQLSATFGGAGPAIVAFFLDLVYRLQIATGVDPGIEFVEPICRYEDSRIVCGDAPARDTVKRLFNVFVSPAESVIGAMASAQDLVGRIFVPPHGGINMAGLFVADSARLAEMARLLLPATVFSTLIALVGNAGASVLDSAPDVLSLSTLKGGTSGFLLPGLSAIVQMLVACYFIASTLRFMTVLISDRDRILTQSILDTAAKLRDKTDENVTIVVVIGLLHTNGILRLLEEHNCAVYRS